MKPLYTETEFENAKSRGLLPLQCIHCEKTFYVQKRAIKDVAKPNRTTTGCFCSHRCVRLHQHPAVSVVCHQCGKKFQKQAARAKKDKNHFCSHSCSAKYSNTHKTKGTRVSKLETWLSQQLPVLYPNLEFHFNRKDAINSEIDIYIPSLKLAFELNGIFHYEPIFSGEQLTKTQNNDNRKILACAEQGIELCIIDVSHQKYFKEQTSLQFLTIIQNIIKNSLIRKFPNHLVNTNVEVF